MKWMVPLYLRWVVGLTAHMALLIALTAWAVVGRYQEPLARVILQQSRPRVEGAIRMLISELELAHPEEWEGLIRRFEANYQVALLLLNERYEPIAGSIRELPEDLIPRLRQPPPGPVRGLIRSRRREIREGPPDTPPAHPAGPPLGLRVERTESPPRWWLVGRVPVRVLGSPPMPFVVAINPQTWTGGLFVDMHPLILGALAIVALSLLAWTPFVLRITGAVRALTAAGRRVAEGRFDARVRLRRSDELGELARTMNELAVRLDAMTRDQKRFLAGIAHELCSPLARLQVALELVAADVGDGGRVHLDAAIREAETMSRLVDDLLNFSRASLGEKGVRIKPVSGRELAELAYSQALREGVGARTDVTVPPDLTLQADPKLLEQAISNVLRNAARYAPNAPVHVRAEPQTEGVLITIEDEGPGVPDEALPRLFDPFYRVEPSRDRAAGGQGLGLTLVRAAIEGMGGTVWAEPRSPHGLVIRMRLPRPQPAGGAQGT